MKHSTCIGIDAHSRKNALCAIDTETGEKREAMLSADPADTLRWIRESGFSEPIACVYEAGPTGFGLARKLQEAGIDCAVAVTSKLAYPKNKMKTDRADAEWLARQLIAGSVRRVAIPTPEEESLRHLSKLRASAADDLKAAKQQVKSFLLLTGTRYTRTKTLWTRKFFEWAASYEFPEPADTFVFREKVAEVARRQGRLDRIEAEIERIIEASPELRDKAARLTAIYGIGKVTAHSLICEVYDFGRFPKGSSFAAFLGLTPSERSSGEKTARGSITKMGSANGRRLMIEAASAYSRRIPRIPKVPKGVSASVAAEAEKCADRLTRRRRYLEERGVIANKAKVAVARELAEWVWHIMVMPA